MCVCVCVCVSECQWGMVVQLGLFDRWPPSRPVKDELLAFVTTLGSAAHIQFPSSANLRCEIRDGRRMVCQGAGEESCTVLTHAEKCLHSQCTLKEVWMDPCVSLEALMTSSLAMNGVSETFSQSPHTAPSVR
uniref:Uncharacterized protein n=1 Tax=Vitrella brassicaformis TaxID=1169539 RepID=A0A7S1KHI5_9ALVE